ncbi:MAG: phosphoenolpyruvate carboxylase [Candidatus Schekmanbacteria bacterium]|nr:phosphoenolpyruvate carboxylase [Candidatus Schekmanbacteria bacterium]
MSTQHPDNVSIPFFLQNNCFQGEDEIKEAYYVFSHLDCQEQMWDCEGKEANEFVIKELLSRYTKFFTENRIGRDLFITLRVPNPALERDEAKILLETLESIPRSYDTAKVVYGDDGIAPIFEVILPMVTKGMEANRVYSYYQRFVVGKERMQLSDSDITIKEWIGEFKPKNIQVIPLIEDIPYMLQADQIIGDYLKNKYLPYMRVFLGRSDPALNYGMLSAIIVIKIALQRLYKLEKNLSIPLYPIIGVGSCPFRGNFTPANIENCLQGYPSVQTFTIQSAFKYDYDEKIVRQAVAQINQHKRTAAEKVDEESLMPIVEKFSQSYRRQLSQIVPLIKQFSQYVPKRRMRKLHTGLFGYTRSFDGEITLPRVITFCASLYSIGLPPELLGFDCLNESEWATIKGVYKGLEQDLASAAAYYNPDVAKLLPEPVNQAIRQTLERIDYKQNSLHREYTGAVIHDSQKQSDETIGEKVISAANVRHFLG